MPIIKCQALKSDLRLSVRPSLGLDMHHLAQKIGRVNNPVFIPVYKLKNLRLLKIFLSLWSDVKALKYGSRLPI